MKCPYCGVNELGTGDINGKCCACENKFNNSGYPLLSDVGELLDKIDELKKDFNPYNFCDYEKLLWGQILRLADKLRANVS